MNENSQGQDLLPGWSALVVLLMIFAALAGITLLTILRGGEGHVATKSEGTVAYGPEDFPEMQFDVELDPAVLAAMQNDEPGVFNVPPPPFSDESIFPCSECHDEMETDFERREMEYMHDEIRLDHGPEERWCFDCHNPADRDRLRLVNGTLIGFDESYRLCGQCHGTIFRDWRSGIHGRRRGYWNGAKEYLLCAHCHNPHAPRFQPMAPLPPPVPPELLHAAEVQQ